MGRAPCCDKSKVKRGPWSPEEDGLLKSFIHAHGTGGNWIALPHKAGLNRCGKSCRLRWLNYLRPDIRHGGFTDHEDFVICSLYLAIGSRWSVIASKLPGRTDNDIKNYWNTKLKKKIMSGKTPGSAPVQPNPSLPFTETEPELTAYDNNGYNSLQASATGMNNNVSAWDVNGWDDKVAPGQQTWDPVHDFFNGVSGQRDTSRQLELPPSSSTCSSNVGGEDDDMDDFWLRLLVDQSTFFGGDHGSERVRWEEKKVNNALDYHVYSSNFNGV